MSQVPGSLIAQRLCCVRRCRKKSVFVCAVCAAPYCSPECRSRHMDDGHGKVCRRIPDFFVPIMARMSVKMAANPRNKSRNGRESRVGRRPKLEGRSLSGGRDRDSSVGRNAGATGKGPSSRTEGGRPASGGDSAGGRSREGAGRCRDGSRTDGRDRGSGTASANSRTSCGSSSKRSTVAGAPGWPPQHSFAPIAPMFTSLVPPEFATLVRDSRENRRKRRDNGGCRIREFPEEFRTANNVKAFYALGDEVIVMPLFSNVTTGFVWVVLLPADAGKRRQFLGALHAALNPPSSAGEPVLLGECAMLDMVHVERLDTLYRGVVVGGAHSTRRFLMHADSGACLLDCEASTPVRRLPLEYEYRLPFTALPLVPPDGYRGYLLKEGLENLRMVLEEGSGLRNRAGLVFKVLDWDEAACVPHVRSSLAAAAPPSAGAEAVLVARTGRVVEFSLVGASEQASLDDLRERLRKVGGVCSKTGKGHRVEPGSLGFTVDPRYGNPRRFVVDGSAANDQLVVEFIDEGGTGLVAEKHCFFLPIAFLRVPPFARKLLLETEEGTAAPCRIADKLIASGLRGVIRVFENPVEKIELSFGDGDSVTGELFECAPSPGGDRRMRGGQDQIAETSDIDDLLSNLDIGAVEDIIRQLQAFSVVPEMERDPTEAPASDRLSSLTGSPAESPVVYSCPEYPGDVTIRELEEGAVITVSVLGVPMINKEGVYWGYDFAAAPVSELKQVKSALALVEGRAQDAAVAAARVESPKMGDLVLAMDEEDDKFKRAFVARGSWVSFLDTGNTAKVEPQDVRRIPPSLLVSPAAANLFMLDGDDVANTKNTKEHYSRIRDLFRCGEPFQVELKVLKRVREDAAAYSAEILAVISG